MTEEILKVIKAAGRIILNADSDKFNIESKSGDVNYVTHYDYEVQSYLFEELSRIAPEAIFIGEEGFEVKSYTDKDSFVIDPIDGTSNFIFDYHHSSISVAYLMNGVPSFGAVYNPYLDELFYAQKGKGAYLYKGKPDGSIQDNSIPLHIKDLLLEEGIAGFGTSPYFRDLADQSFELARKIFDHVIDVRRSGSAALDLSYIAASRFVMFAECRLSPWDYAAGSLIVQEAGGIVTTLEKEPLSYNRPCSIIAATPAAYREFYNL